MFGGGQSFVFAMQGKQAPRKPSAAKKPKQAKKQEAVKKQMALGVVPAGKPALKQPAKKPSAKKPPEEEEPSIGSLLATLS